MILEDYDRQVIDAYILQRYNGLTDEEGELLRVQLIEKWGFVPRIIDTGLADEAYSDPLLQEYFERMRAVPFRSLLAVKARTILVIIWIVLPIAIIPLAAFFLIPDPGPVAFQIAAISAIVLASLFVLSQLLQKRMEAVKEYSLDDVPLILSRKRLKSHAMKQETRCFGERNYEVTERPERIDLKHEIAESVFNRYLHDSLHGMRALMSYFFAVDYLLHYGGADRGRVLAKGLDVLYRLVGFRAENEFLAYRIMWYSFMAGDYDETLRWIHRSGLPHYRLTSEYMKSCCEYCREIGSAP